MKEIVIATRNEYKRRLFEYIFKDLGLNVKTLNDFDFTDKVDETGKDQTENALIKARFWGKKIGLPVFGDDAGVEIDALGGEPGLEVRRWRGRFRDDVEDEVWLEYLLKRMEGVAPKDRAAKGRSAWAVVMPDGREISKEVVYDILILERPIRPYPSGSPLSAVWFNARHQKPMMELTEKEQWEPFLEAMNNWKELKWILEK